MTIKKVKSFQVGKEFKKKRKFQDEKEEQEEIRD
jgi:hypothetical protein